MPAGRIAIGSTRLQTVLLAPDKPSIYRIHATDGLIVEADGAERTIRIEPGASLDVLARKIRVKAAGGGTGHIAQGWCVMVS